MTRRKNTELDIAKMSIKYFCPDLDKNISIKIDNSNYYFSGHSEECGTCSSHGGVYLYITCKCGTVHKIELSGW